MRRQLKLTLLVGLVVYPIVTALLYIKAWLIPDLPLPIVTLILVSVLAPLLVLVIVPRLNTWLSRGA